MKTLDQIVDNACYGRDAATYNEVNVYRATIVACHDACVDATADYIHGGGCDKQLNKVIVNLYAAYRDGVIDSLNRPVSLACQAAVEAAVFRERAP